MTNEERLHVAAADYATTRKQNYLAAVEAGRADAVPEKTLNWIWLAHYEGWRAGQIWRSQETNK